MADEKKAKAFNQGLRRWSATELTKAIGLYKEAYANRWAGGRPLPPSRAQVDKFNDDLVCPIYFPYTVFSIIA